MAATTTGQAGQDPGGQDPGGQDPDGPTLAGLIAPHLPYLRRFARALAGDQAAGDARVAATLGALIADRAAIDLRHGPRIALYRLFLAGWPGAERTAPPEPAAARSAAERRIARLTPRPRLLLLLTAVEDFTLSEAAAVMGIALGEAEALLGEARAGLARQGGARVMIIEDEPIIALDLESIVAGMGHEVVGIAGTHRSAVATAAATAPDLVLADIQLADGSSGIDAVEDILAERPVPVIFVTAYPERLLTGRRPEPTFLVTKPFRPETVEATIAQVLFHHG